MTILRLNQQYVSELVAGLRQKNFLKISMYDFHFERTRSLDRSTAQHELEINGIRLIKIRMERSVLNSSD